jgi:hypothetical protein
MNLLSDISPKDTNGTFGSSLMITCLACVWGATYLSLLLALVVKYEITKALPLSLFFSGFSSPFRAQAYYSVP